MKGSVPRLVLLGNNSGNNLGDAAIMTAIMDSVSKELPDTEFYVPSIKPSFINDNYSKTYKVKGLDAMPWTGSVRLFGIPTLYAMYKSDAALICDGIIFGKKLFNPLFNFLITLIFLVPFAKLFRCKLVCYCCGIGPFPDFFSKTFARWVINACDLVTMREEDSINLAKEIGVTQEIILTGDVAVINPVSSEDRAKEIFKELELDWNHKYIGVNITRYIDGWLYDPNHKISDKASLVAAIADGVKQTIKNLDTNVQPLVFSTQPMDDEISTQLANLLNTKVIGNSRYLSHDIQAAMAKCSLFTGMRVHSLYLASAVGCPIVGMIYAPKVRSYFKQLATPEYGIELADITEDSLSKLLTKAWQEKLELKNKQQVVVEHIKEQARRTVKLLENIL